MGVKPTETRRKTILQGDSTDGADAVGETLSDTISDLDGPLLGRFEVGRELGRGGMGRVLEGRDPKLRRWVAIKVISEPRRASPEALARFVTEAQLTSQLEHPGIVPVHEMGVDASGQAFFVMKKVEGQSLGQILRDLKHGDATMRRRWTQHRLLTTFIRATQAVAYAHDRRVLHRDLKPDNIMVGAHGEVLVLDWGLARLIGSNETEDRGVDLATRGRTSDGLLLGTPGYASPEQARGQLDQVDSRSDVWSLGAILYEILTGERAYNGSGAVEILYRAMTLAPVDPRERTPERRIDDEIAEICLRALAVDPKLRPASARDLYEEVEAFLEGARRRAAAEVEMQQARERQLAYRAIMGERAALEAREKALAARVVPSAALEDPVKSEYLQVRERIDALGPEEEKRFSQIVSAAERALSQDPGALGARDFLADLYLERFEDAERRRDARAEAFFRGRVEEYDGGRHARLLAGTGSLSLVTTPAGAEVICERYHQAGLAWTLVDRRSLGETPLVDVPLEMGSYLLTLELAGKRPTRYPVYIRRGRRWSSGPDPIPLLSDAEIGDDFVYIPAGPTLVGGDRDAGAQLEAGERDVPGFLLARYPVTAGEYALFLEWLHARSPAEAWQRSPRDQHATHADSLRFWPALESGGRYEFPLRDKDGDEWQSRWPICGITWTDANAYAAWRSDRDGVPNRLMLDLEYEKAARGVDGRRFPWGNTFDPAACKMALSRAGQPRPEAVGTFALDSSPYGVRDLAGGIRQWCGDDSFDGEPKLRAIRGGAWTSAERICRAANRFGLDHRFVHPYLGFRLAQSNRSRGIRPKLS